MAIYPHKFPRGYKTWRILKNVKTLKGARYTDIVRMAYELNYGHGSFDSKLNRGYWSDAFAPATGNGDPWPWSRKKSAGPMAAYLTKGEDGLYRINSAGESFIRKYDLKFFGKQPTEIIDMKKSKSDRMEKFQVKYADQIERVKQRMEAKKIVGPSQTSNKEIIPEQSVATSPEVPFRGLKLGDKVGYYSKNGNKSGVGYVFSITEFATGTGLTPKMKVRDSLTSVFGQGLELHYDSKTDKFMDGIKECEIVKL